jgi:hypothetical protein
MDRPTTDPASQDDATRADAEELERLSRAARDVIHQPADPRLEKAFGHLGLFPDADPAAPPAERPSRAVVTGEAQPAVPPAQPVDLEPLRADMVSLRASVERLDRRIGTVIGLLAVLAVVVGMVAVLVLIRAAA